MKSKIIMWAWGTRFLQGILNTGCSDANKKTHAVFFSKKHKIFNWICTFKKRKTHLEMTYFILMKGFLNVFQILAL